MVGALLRSRVLLAIMSGEFMLESLKNVQVLSGALKLSLTFEGL